MRLNKIEKIKAQGVTIDLREMANLGYEGISPADHYRLKTQGICAQRGTGYFMLRIKVPHGQADARRLEKMAILSRKYADGYLHLTTRQGAELHTVDIKNVPVVLGELATVNLTTLASCGDTIRNIMTCNGAGFCPTEAFDVRPWAEYLSTYFLSYGPEKLNIPRKMNIYLGACNGADGCGGQAQISDIGYVATWQGEKPGFTIWVGGGLGANPRLAFKLFEFIPAEDMLLATAALVDLYIEHGLRQSRAEAKLKFLIEEWGWEKFQQTYSEWYARYQEAWQENGTTVNFGPPVERSSPITPAIPPSIPDDAYCTCINTGEYENGAMPQRQNGYSRVPVHVAGGDMTARQVELIAGLCVRYGRGYVLITREQNIEIPWVRDADVSLLIEELHDRTKLTTKEASSLVDVQACPGTTFCQLGITDAPATSRALSTRLQQYLATKEDRTLRHLRVHISGCPNSCALHQAADIGLGGVRVLTANAPHPTGDKPTNNIEATEQESNPGYQLFIGGAMHKGTAALGDIAHYAIPDDRVPDVVIAIIDLYARERRGSESLREFVERSGLPAIQETIEAQLTPAYSG